MVKGFYFGLGFFLNPQERSIFDICKIVSSLLQDVFRFDTRFESPIFMSRLGHSVNLDIRDPNLSQSLAYHFLESVKDDIEINNEIKDAKVDYSRGFGFTSSYTFGETGIMLSGRLGSLEAEGMSFSFPLEFEETVDWYIGLLKVCVKSTDSLFGSMQLKVATYTSQINDLKYPIGLITYFARDLGLNVVDCFSDLEIQQSDKGVYLIVERGAVTAEKESYEAFKDRLLTVNNLLRKCDPRVQGDSVHPA